VVADRFYCPEPPVEGRLSLLGDEARHLSRVLRAGPGDIVEVFDGRGTAYRAEVRDVARDRVELAVAGDPLPERGPRRQVVLATAVPKGERFDWLVEKATELGVARLVPILAERSAVDPRPAKLDRLRRAVVEASKQCGRNRLMELAPPARWGDLLHDWTGFDRLLAHPGGTSPGLRNAPGRHAGVVVAIGPEGGFTDAEVADARRAGWGLVGLGPTTLRIETAAIVAAALALVPGGRACEGEEGP
jgi:16S rRNA (uracil1498-N3)-methyltransferase